MSNNGGAIIVLVIIWGFVIYYIYNFWPHILVYSVDSFLGSIIRFLW